MNLIHIILVGDILYLVIKEDFEDNVRTASLCNYSLGGVAFKGGKPHRDAVCKNPCAKHNQEASKYNDL